MNSPICFTFFALNDFLSHLSPFHSFFPGEQTEKPAGGVARMATTIIRAKQENPGRTMALVMGLDFCGPLFHLLCGKAEFEALGQAGFDAGVPGIHELDMGPEAFIKSLQHKSFPLLCANLESDNPALSEHILPRMTVKTPEGKIGIFGLNIVPPAAKLRFGNLLRERNDLATVAREQVAALQKEGCKVIIAATHIGLESDRRLAQQVEGIHAIFGGHSHTITNDPEQVKTADGWTTLITQSGTGGISLGRLDLILDDSGKTDFENTRWSLVPMDECVSPKPALSQAVNHWEEKTRTFLETRVGALDKPADGQKKTLYNGESTLGNLITDAIRWRSGADIAILSSDQINGNAIHQPGPITWGDVYSWFPFFQSIFCFELSGDVLLETLKISGSALKANNTITAPTAVRRGSLLQHSGLRVQYGRDGSLFQVLVESTEEWNPIDPSSTYVVAGTSWYLHGGDGYGLLSKEKNWSIGCHDAGAVGTYLTRCKSPCCPSIEGRITIK